MSRKKTAWLLAIGLLIVTANSVVRRFLLPAEDFLAGCLYGVGLGLTLLVLYRMRFKSNI